MSTVFSGKLSPMMTNSADQLRINPLAQPEPLAQSEQGTEPAPVPTPAKVGCEVGGREGPEPTRFGDWELRGRCIDF